MICTSKCAKCWCNNPNRCNIDFHRVLCTSVRKRGTGVHIGSPVHAYTCCTMYTSEQTHSLMARLQTLSGWLRSVTGAHHHDRQAHSQSMTGEHVPSRVSSGHLRASIAGVELSTTCWLCFISFVSNKSHSRKSWSTRRN